ncbi:hypothetical protein F5Y10DRAFT_217346 [Nemania abortiva]|nr:hypothetical protein F5Y10DRAFT_217346 [Nemania abortiva]
MICSGHHHCSPIRRTKQKAPGHGGAVTVPISGSTPLCEIPSSNIIETKTTTRPPIPSPRRLLTLGIPPANPVVVYFSLSLFTSPASEEIHIRQLILFRHVLSRIARALQPWPPSSPVSRSSATISASPRSVAKSARNPALWFALESSVSRSHPTPGSPSSPKLSVLGVVSALKNALSARSRLSICLRTSRVKLPTDTLPTASRFTDCPRLVQAKCWVLLEQMVSAKAQL